MNHLSEICLAAIFIAPLAGAGLAMMNSGLGRSRSAAHTMLSSMLLMSAGALAYLICGAAFLDGWSAAIATTVRGHTWSWLGLSGFFLHGIDWDGSGAFPERPLTILHGLVCASLTALIPFGAGGDRWRLASASAIGALLAGVAFPVFGHWAWSDVGWLTHLDQLAGLPRGYSDGGGAGAVHVTGGAAALALVWMLGPRHARYNDSGIPAAVPGHDAVLAVAGAFLALIGWLGLNCAGALLYGKASAMRLALVGLNTILCAAAGAIASALFTKSRYGRPDASLCANGWTGGLVASSAAAAFVHPAAAALIGVVAGVMVAFAIEMLDVHLAFDDPGGTVAVHFLCGLWGLLAAGLFGSANLMAQVVGIATLIGFVFPLAFGIVWMTSRFVPLRTTPEGDRQGMDLHELGANAYPEFMMHHEDSWGR